MPVTARMRTFVLSHTASLYRYDQPVKFDRREPKVIATSCPACPAIGPFSPLPTGITPGDQLGNTPT
jgi:hypothetical protein